MVDYLVNVLQVDIHAKNKEEQNDLFGIKHFDETATRARLSVCV